MRERHDEWHNAIILTSALPRARETGQLVMGADDLPANARCNELEPGDADGWTWDVYRERVAVPDWSSNPDAPFAPGGESWRGFAQRVERCLNELSVEHGARRVVVFTHGGFIEQAIRAVTHEDDDVRLRLRTDHCSVTEVEWGPRRRLLRYNERAV
jgi:probable phosphoglycerate mutase